jgi:DnaJ like chaperone protein
MHSEMEFVRRFLRANFGEEAAIEGNRILLNLFEQRKQMDAQDPSSFKNTIYNCGRQIKMNLSHEERLQLLNFLAMIAKSDGHVCQAEIEALKETAIAMGLSASEVESMLNLGTASLDAAYKVLEVEPSATDDEVKAAYRKLALKHHPDRVASLGEDIRKAAEEKRRAEIKAHNDMINAKIAEAEQALKAQNAIYAANAGKIFGSGAKLKKAAKAEIARLESAIANLKRTLR